MGIVVNTNVPSLITQRNLNSATNSLNQAMERMSTGSKINKAADDAAGLFVGITMDAQIRGSEQAQSNVQIGTNVLQKAEGDLTIIQDNVQRIRDLAVQASNEVYNDESLDAIKSEVYARMDEISRVANASEFNGKKLFSSGKATTGAPVDDTKKAVESLTFQVGPNSVKEENAITVTGVFGDMTVSGTDLALFDPNTFNNNITNANPGAFSGDVEAAEAYIATCDAALEKIATKRSKIGSYQNRLDSALSSLTVSIENLSSAKSTIMDTDVAKASSDYIKSQILQQSTASLLTQANSAPQIALSLIG